MEAHVLSEFDPKFFAETEEEDGARQLPSLKAALPYQSLQTIQPIPTTKPMMNTNVKNEK